MKNVSWLAILLVALAAAAFAQSDRGTVTGTVTDAQGAFVPSAQVMLTSLATGLERRVQTTDAGVFSITSVPSGAYSLSVEQPGFQKYTQTGITVAVAQTVRVDVTLTVGSTTESVTVTADATLLKTESAEHSTVIHPANFNELPLRVSGGVRSPFDFIVLSPGVFGSSSWDIKVNGSPSDSFRVLLDGQEAHTTINPGIFQNIQPSVEGLEEMALQSTGFSAEFGQVGAGMLNMTPRSGTNDYHGTVYDILINEAFNAGGPYTTDGAGHHVRPRQRQHDWGFNIGGPVRIPKLYNGANRTFFFFNFEQFYQKQQSYKISSVPSEAFRNGDFGYLQTGRTLNTDGLGRPIQEGVIYDPRTDRTVNGRVYRDPFPSNRVPTAMFDPVAQKIQALIPKPNINVPGGVPVNNFENSLTAIRKDNLPSIKIDHNFTPNARVSGYANWTVSNQPAGNWPDAFDYPITALRAYESYALTDRITYDHTITPTLLNHLGVGYQHFHNRDSTPYRDYDQMKELGLRGALVGGFPRITGAFVNMGPQTYNYYTVEKPTVVESLTWVRGAHTFKFGGEFKIDAYSFITSQPAIGNYGFSNLQTALPAAEGMNLSGGSIGYGYASFLLGMVNTQSIGNPTSPQHRRTNWGFYGQDSWKVNRRLTLEAGLRWDYQPQYHEIWHRDTQWDRNIVNPSAGGLKGGTMYAGYGPGRCNCDFVPAYPYAVAPRLGLAYRFGSKTVLRAGWGISYGQVSAAMDSSGAEFTAGNLGHGFNSISLSNPAYGMPVARLQDGLVYDVAKLFATNYDPGIRPSPGQLNSPPAHLDENGGRPPRTMNWSIGIQRELWSNWMVEAAYVGNRGVWWRADGLVNYNAIEPEWLLMRGIDIRKAEDRTLLTSRLDSPIAKARGFGAPYAGYPMSATVAQSLRPFPQFGTLASRMAPLGNTWYDSLQVKATKRYSSGLSFGASYTWSKTLGTVEGARNDVANRSLAKSITSYDRPHMLSINAVWEVPAFGFARTNYFGRMLLGGWTMGALLRYSSGALFAAPSSQNNLSALLFQSTVMNRVAGEPLYTKDLNCHSCWDPNKDFVLNPKAWAEAAPGEWGTAAKYYSDFRSARSPDEQIQLTKGFRIREGMSLNARFELFNTFNRMRWPSPAAGNPLATQRRDASGKPIDGYGYVNAAGTGGQRGGQLVLRFQF